MDKSHTVHNLKTWPDEFQAVGEEAKLFDFRRNDRDFKVGDFLQLFEYEPDLGRYTGEVLMVRVTYILPLSKFEIGLSEYVVMGIELV